MQQNSEQSSSQFVDSSSTLNSLSQSNQDCQLCKIMGYVQPQHQGDDYFPLKMILPTTQKLLMRMMINLIEMVIEVEQRAFPLPNITIDKIMLHKKNHQVGLVYLFAPINEAQKSQGNNFEQIRHLIKILSFDRQIYLKPKNLRELADIIWDQLMNIDVDQIRRKYIEKFGNFSNYCAQMLGIQIQGDSPLYVNENVIAVFSSEKHSFIEPPENQKIAIKFAQDQEEGYQRREIEILEKLNLPYTSKLYCYMRIKNITVLILKYHDKTLLEIQKKLVEIQKTEDQQLVQKIFVYFFKLILISLQKLHDQGITHRDLKPENLMFDFAKPVKTIEDYFDAVCIIIDFDRSKDKQDNIISCYQGTPNYIPPEGVLEKYPPSYDIYQVGMIFFLTTFHIREYTKCFKQHGQRPLDPESYEQLLQKILQCQQIVKVSDELMNLIKTMIRHKPEERPTAQEVIKILSQI